MTTEEGNKLIAEFMGGKPYYLDADVITFPMMDNPAQSLNNTTTHHAGKLKYHVSWDWIMGVVNRIEALEKLKGVDELTFYDKKAAIRLLYFTTPITEVWERIIQFITWYNSFINQKPKTNG